MNEPEHVVKDVARRLARTWSTELAREVSSAIPPEQVIPAWPHRFPVGSVSTAALTQDFPALAALSRRWREWAEGHRVSVLFGVRRVLGTAQELPTHLVIDSLDTAARIADAGWPQRVLRGRRRAALLHRTYPQLATQNRLARVLATVDGYTDVDVALLCRAADWFAVHDAQGLTPRQVPVEGLHAKWLNTSQAMVRELADVTDLQLAPPHPPRLHLSYLDPAHLAAGRRRHDSATVCDRMTPAYRPRAVVISENKDTAIHFPALAEAISIEGMGRGGTTAAAFDWVTAAELIIYWGDMDLDGLEILNEFRAAGIPARSLLMDLAAYDRWRIYGTDTDARGRPLVPRPPRPVPYLTDAETALYQHLADARTTGPRRIEQERIPLTVALEAVRALINPSA